VLYLFGGAVALVAAPGAGLLALRLPEALVLALDALLATPREALP
jgi:hypothetical protein